MKKYCFVAFNLLASCTVIPTSSHFADGQLTLNLDKQTVIERYGNPFSMDISIDTVVRKWEEFKDGEKL